jgi:hypothetical protein
MWSRGPSSVRVVGGLLVRCRLTSCFCGCHAIGIRTGRQRSTSLWPSRPSSPRGDLRPHQHGRRLTQVARTFPTLSAAFDCGSTTTQRVDDLGLDLERLCVLAVTGVELFGVPQRWFCRAVRRTLERARAVSNSASRLGRRGCRRPDRAGLRVDACPRARVWRSCGFRDQPTPVRSDSGRRVLVE